jgi:hypothetical protein
MKKAPIDWRLGIKINSLRVAQPGDFVKGQAEEEA